MTVKIPNTIDLRRDFIKKNLQKFKGTSIKCKSLNGMPIYITARTINEIATHASKSEKSTLAALSIKKIIESSRFVKMYFPKENRTQIEVFQFVFIFEMKANIKNIGEVKFTMGARNNGKFIAYCITSK